MPIVLLPLILLGLLLRGTLGDPSFSIPSFHFLVVSLASSLSVFLALFILLAARQVRDARVLFLGLTFYSMAGIFLIHALTTPGAMIPNDNNWVGISARLSIMVGALFLAVSTIEWRPAQSEFLLNRWGVILLLTTIAIIGYGYVAIAGSTTVGVGYGAVATSAPSTDGYGTAAVSAATAPPTSASAAVVPAPSKDLDDILSSPEVSTGTAAFTLLVLVAVALRQAILYRRTGRPLHGGFFATTALLAQAQLSMFIAPVWHVSWWEYHGLMLAAFAIAIGGVVVEFGRGVGLAGVFEGLLLHEAVTEVERGYTEVVSALVEAIEAKDPYTRGHTQRVSDLAVLIGEELGLSADDLELLHRSALLHDIGKIAIPDAILNKPGRLTPAEFDVVKQHPARGHLIIQNVRSLQNTITGVRHHHERLDGSGYPDGLSGDGISLIARIIAVADVYDAVTSARPYRGASPSSEGLAIIDQEAGSKLDPVCVAALHRAYLRLPVDNVEPIRILGRAA